MTAFLLGRRPRGTVQDGELGMLDVSANALAVLILATMMVISAAATPSVRGEVRLEKTPELFYPAPIDSTLPPNSRYMLVLAEGLVEIDVDAFAEGLFSGEATAETEQGRAVLVTDRRNYRDLNDYRLQINPDWDVLSQNATVLGQEAAIEEARTAADAYDNSNFATTYLVVEDAIENFAPLYWHLRAAQTPIRWAVVQKGEHFGLSRRVENFERTPGKWQ